LALVGSNLLGVSWVESGRPRRIKTYTSGTTPFWLANDHEILRRPEFRKQSDPRNQRAVSKGVNERYLMKEG